MSSPSSTPEAREAALERIKARRGFNQFIVTTLAMNVFLLAIWALTGAGFFWPGFVMAGSVIAIVTRWAALRNGSVSDAEVEAEIARESR